MIDIKETLMKLSSLTGPSGYERPVAESARELLAPYCDDVRIDRLGNVLGRIRCGRENAKTVLLDAHLDEIGFMITAEEDGFYQFRTLGGVDPRMLPGAELLLLAEERTVPAVVACLPPHVLKPGDSDKAQKVEELYLDTGGVPVPVGTIGVFATTPFVLGGELCGKSLDDRACFVALLRALDHIDKAALPVDVIVCGSVQEEVGGRGAAVAAYDVWPDWAVAVDVTFAKSPDTPSSPALGAGVIIDMGPNCNRKTVARLAELARAKEIPYAHEVSPGNSGTNATDMQIARSGLATNVLSLPLRYMHTPVEVIRESDVEQCARLMGEWVMQLC